MSKAKLLLPLFLLAGILILVSTPTPAQAAQCSECYGSCPGSDNEYWCVQSDCDVFICNTAINHWTPAGYKQPGACGCTMPSDPPPPPPPPQTHWECSNLSCVEVSGPGTNECPSYYASISDACSRLICQGLACARAVGDGIDECPTDTSGGISSDCSRLTCQSDACVRVAGQGSDECSTETGPGNISDDCTHLACDGLMCKRVSNSVLNEPDECSSENLPSVPCFQKMLDDVPDYRGEHPNQLDTCDQPVEPMEDFSECCATGASGPETEQQSALMALLNLAKSLHEICQNFGSCPQSPIQIKLALTFGQTFESTKRLDPTADYFNRMFNNFSSPLTVVERFPDGESSEEEEKQAYVEWVAGLVGEEEDLARGGHQKMLALHNSASAIKGYSVRVPISTGQLTPPKYLADLQSTAEQRYLASFPPKVPDLQTQTALVGEPSPDPSGITLNIEPVNYSPAQPVVLGTQTTCPPKVPASKEQMACHLDSDGWLFPSPREILDAMAGNLQITLKIPYLGLIARNMTGIEVAEDDPAREESDYDDGGFYNIFRNPIDPGYTDRAGDARIDNLYLQVWFEKGGSAGIFDPLITRLVAYTQIHPFSIEFPGSGLLLTYMGLDQAVLNEVGPHLMDPLTATSWMESLEN